MHTLLKTVIYNWVIRCFGYLSYFVGSYCGCSGETCFCIPLEPEVTQLRGDEQLRAKICTSRRSEALSASGYPQLPILDKDLVV